MRPDLAISPPSGSSLAPGPAAVSWAAPAGAERLLVLVGTSPGDSDVEVLELAPGDPLDFTVPAEAGRVYVTAVLDLVAGDVFAYSLVYPVLGATLPPETVMRRLLSSYWLEEWLGPDLLEPRFCPAGVPGLVDFEPESEEDAAPWTPAQVADAVGFAVLRFQEVDRWDDGVTGGQETTADGALVFVSGEYRLWNLEFELRVPSKSTDPAAVLDLRAQAIEDLFRGFSILHAGPPAMSIRNLSQYPARTRDGGDDGTWKRKFVDVKVRARVRQQHRGTKEVALP